MEVSAKVAASSLLEISTWVRSRYEQNEGDLVYYEKEFNDLTHALEFVEFDKDNGFEIAKQLRENRINRRLAKDENEVLKPLYELLRKYKTLENELNSIKVKTRNVLTGQSNRVYKPRVRSDMQEAFDKAKNRLSCEQ